MNRFRRYRGIRIWLFISICLTFASLAIILGYIFIHGINELSIQFLLGTPQGFPLGIEGGIWPAIMGSLGFTSIACLFGSILAIPTAIWLVFYNKNLCITSLCHFFIYSMAGVPSIILGLFGYAFFVVTLKLGVSLLSGGLILGVMIFPFIEVRVEKSFREFPLQLVQASLALGVTRTWTLFHLVFPASLGDIASAIALGGSFAMGATAPILFTGAVLFAPVPRSLFSPAMALPNHLYILVGQGISLSKAYGTALVLIIILLALNSVPIFIRMHRKEG
ncbi:MULTISPECIES: PstA family ABC transporter permease [Aminobacterium]|jgi:phosphate transport system permease protein|uniref:PstA family ABC transporter permease n=1 Tax=Aminobacterium TaxID=81466 RepID=UPI00257F96A3|nr:MULTISPECIES: ABC transporter permease subunit [unclassified Aminobacterium]